MRPLISWQFLCILLSAMRGRVRLGGRRLVLLLAGVLLTGAAVITPSAAPDASGERVDFRRDIQPFLEASCT